MSTVYAFKDSAHFRAGFDRTAGAARLASILERDGSLDLSAIVADGLNPDSPLHPEFNVSTEEALEVYRAGRADYLRRAFIVIQIDEATNERREYRAVVQVSPRDDPDHYRHIPLVSAMADEEYREQVLWRALSELIAVRRKYRDLTELARIFTAIDATAKKFRKDTAA